MKPIYSRAKRAGQPSAAKSIAACSDVGAYLDYAATTPVDPRVLEAMLPYFGSQKLPATSYKLKAGLWGNPGSLHSFGQKASAAVFNSRRIIAQAIGAHYSEIIFTGSATEANNLALRGAVRGWVRNVRNVGDVRGGQAKRSNISIKRSDQTFPTHPRIIISATEHDSIFDTARNLAKDGVEVIYIPVSKQGIVDVPAIKKNLNDRTVLVSVMYANNEIGTIQPISEIAEIIQQFRVRNVGNVKNNSNNPPAGGDRTIRTFPTGKAYPLFHTDAVQAFQYLNCDVSALGVDILTLSAHKIYGPKGIGVLYVRRTVDNKQLTADQGSQGSSVKGQVYNYRLEPIIVGGGQEEGLRSGTENVPAIVGFAKAVELVGAGREKETARVSVLRDYLWRGVRKMFPRVVLNGPSLAGATRLPNHLNIYLQGQTAEEILTTLDLQGTAISSGSACSARSPEPSKVLLALGATKDRAKNSVRITLGRPTTKAEINRFLSAFKKLK